ncbi:hypothetical protein K435DRAFT_786238 [Dendrothele bispora CBS 962.96]|uniref:Uncharacterized protein n=1 Tax=Dendrothele bispora (strain CBS 962.96) TaxID=1314807 RepID=A0A4S8KS64_DENBC|nr:hypothetical protein K435DRAFT_786238 [Dendrothele bispora CBS 962.96]
MPVHRPTASIRGRTLLCQPCSSAVPVQRTASSDPQAGRPVTTTNRSRTTRHKKTGTMNGSSATQPTRRILRQ